MAYYTAVYQKAPDFYFETLVWKNDNDFRVYQVGGRYMLIKDGYKIAEMIEMDRLETAFKGSFQVWVNTIEKKDKEKVAKLQQYQQNISNDIEVIQNIWKKFNNSKNFKVDDYVRHERGYVGKVMEVEYNDADECLVEWFGSARGNVAPRTSIQYLDLYLKDK